MVNPGITNEAIPFTTTAVTKKSPIAPSCTEAGYDVYEAVNCVDGEGLFRFHENPNPDCPVGKNIHMALDGKLMDVQRSMENELRRISIADVAVQLKEEIESRKEA